MSTTKISVLKLLLTMITVAGLIACDFFDSTPKCASEEVRTTLESIILKDIKNKVSNKNIGKLISDSSEQSVQYVGGLMDNFSGTFKTSANIKIGFDNFLTNDKAEGKKRNCSSFVTYKIENFQIKFENSIQADIYKKMILGSMDVNLDPTQFANNFMNAFQTSAKMESDPNYVNILTDKLNKKVASAIPTKAKIDYTVQKTDSGKEFYISILDITATE